MNRSGSSQRQPRDRRRSGDEPGRSRLLGIEDFGDAILDFLEAESPMAQRFGQLPPGAADVFLVGLYGLEMRVGDDCSPAPSSVIRARHTRLARSRAKLKSLSQSPAAVHGRETAPGRSFAWRYLPRGKASVDLAPRHKVDRWCVQVPAFFNAKDGRGCLAWGSRDNARNLHGP